MASAALVAGLVALIALTWRVGRWLQASGRRMMVNAPPLTGNLDPRVSPGSVASVAVGALGVWRAPELSAQLRWRRLLRCVFLAGLAWAIALAAWDGAAGFTRSPSSPVDFLRVVPDVGSVRSFVDGFVSGIGAFPGHVRSHPPGMVLLLVAMDRLGFHGVWPAAALELTAAAAAAPAVLIGIRETAGESPARAAAPFLALAGTAVFWGSADAVFMGVGAWASACMILAAYRDGRRSDALALAGGALWAVGLFCSYGQVLLALVPLAVVVSRRRWRAVVLAAVPVAAVVTIFVLLGFAWWRGLAASLDQYASSISRVRPYSFFVFANVAAFAIAVGPATIASLARLRDRRLWLLVGAALVGVAIADVSGLSKAEVERIWLPFAPWVIAATGGGFASLRQRRGWFAAQVATTIAVQAVVLSPW